MNYNKLLPLIFLLLSISSCHKQRRSARETVSDVVSFMNVADLGYSSQSGFSSASSNYYKFTYNENDCTLNYYRLDNRALYMIDPASQKVAQIVDLRECFKYKLFIHSAEPSVIVNDYDTISNPKGYGKTKSVRLMAKVSYSYMNARDYNSSTNEFLVLDNLPHSEPKVRPVEFIVPSAEVAQRLKVALEDLLKAHGVHISNY
jgi:hypothetical protein